MKIDTTIQASAHLLKASGGPVSRLRLLKLLYLAERRLLVEGWCSLTGDEPVAMNKGPVLIHTNAAIDGQGPMAAEWKKFFENAGGNGVMLRLIADPGNGALSPAIVDILNEEVEKFRDVDDEELSEQTHHLVEWIEAWKPTSADAPFPIPWDHTLELIGKPEIAAELRAQDELHRAMEGLGA